MKKASLAIVAIATLAIAACGGRNEDQVNQADVNTTADADLNQLSDEAAEVASEAQELENQAAALEQETKAVENASGAETKYDENIQGM